jgi:hypothetical protein
MNFVNTKELILVSTLSSKPGNTVKVESDLEGNTLASHCTHGTDYMLAGCSMLVSCSLILQDSRCR